MTIEELAKIIGGLPVADSSVRVVLSAWFEDDFPTRAEVLDAEKRADEILENIAKTASAYARDTR